MIGLAQVAMEGHDPGHHFPLSHVHKRVVLLSGHYTGSNDRNFCSLITGRLRRYYTHPTEGCSDLRVRDCRLPAASSNSTPGTYQSCSPSGYTGITVRYV
jgi:hypothetical protein